MGYWQKRKQRNEFLSSIANLGKGFLDIFVTFFGDMVSGTLGIKADTKKSEIGEYFSDIEKAMILVKNKLSTVVAENGNYPKVKEVVEQFIIGTLDRIAEGAKEAARGSIGAGSELIGSATKNSDAVAPHQADLINHCYCCKGGY